MQRGNGPKHDRERSRYHRNIRVEGNTFRVFDPRIVNLYCVDGFVFTRDNVIEYTDDYPRFTSTKSAISSRGIATALSSIRNKPTKNKRLFPMKRLFFFAALVLLLAVQLPAG